ncbi:MAG: DUF1016 N-terminal domain-containing protein [Chitinophagaceae bacterium]
MTPTQKNTHLYISIKSLIENAKIQITRRINTTIILTYYEIGRMIVEDEQNGNHRADYANEVWVNLSKQLSKEFGKGYSLTQQ